MKDLVSNNILQIFKITDSPFAVTSKSAQKTIFISHVSELKYFYGN